MSEEYARQRVRELVVEVNALKSAIKAIIKTNPYLIVPVEVLDAVKPIADEEESSELPRV